MEADIVPYYDISVLLCVIHMVCRYQNVVQSVQKCDHVGCVVWTKVGMAVEDTISMCDGGTHCDVATTLARNIYNGSVTNDVPSPSPGLCEVEASLINENKLMWDHISIHFQYSLKTKTKKSVNMV